MTSPPSRKSIDTFLRMNGHLECDNDEAYAFFMRRFETRTFRFTELSRPQVQVQVGGIGDAESPYSVLDLYRGPQEDTSPHKIAHCLVVPPEQSTSCPCGLINCRQH